MGGSSTDPDTGQEFDMNARNLSLAAVLVISAGLAPISIAQPQTDPGLIRTDPVPQRETLRRMTKPISVTTENIRIQDAIEFLKQVTGADL
ncbi:MAG: hypothetical protein DRJ50_12900, partial [Actinobacteria bacterium]